MGGRKVAAAMIRVHTIISGAQTGADRGALEAAEILGLKRGGMAPLGWRAEDGVIPERYRVGMMQSPSADYPTRTRANVEASSGTLILSLEQIANESGSMLTAKLARKLGKPCMHVIIERDGVIGWFVRTMLVSWLEEKNILTLNVAGPRESREPGIQAAARDALVEILKPPVDDGFGWDPT